MDKSAMSHAAILGLRTELGMRGEDYSWASSIYFFGFLVFSYPASVLLVKLPIGKCYAVATMIWAVIMMCIAGAHDAGGIQTARFFLGFAEAVLPPATIVIIAMFYKTEEQPLRLGVWTFGTLCSAAFGSLIPYGLAHTHGDIPTWKVLFLLCGSCTLVWGVALYFLMPNTPMSAWFLNKEDRAKAVLRVQSNRTGIKSDIWKKAQCQGALTDPIAWLLVLSNMSSNIVVSGTMSFASIIIQGMGFTAVNTFLVGLIGVAVQAVSLVASSILCHHFKNTRTVWCIVTLFIAIGGAVMVRKLPHERLWTRYGGFCLMNTAVIVFPLTYSMVSANFGGFTRKTTVNAMIMIAYSVGSIVGPHFFFDRESPDYPSGFLAIMVSLGVCVVACLALRMYLSSENKRRDRMGHTTSIACPGGTGGEANASVPADMMDRTDREILEFRYVY